MPQKLESMCASYEQWDSWFGHKQKFSPSNVQSGSTAPPQDSEDGEEDGSDGDGIDGIVDNIDGGVDGELGTVGNDAAEGANQQQIGVGESADSAEVLPVPDGTAASAGTAVAAPLVTDSQRESNRGKQTSVAKQQIATASALVSSAISSSPTATKADKFDATYASVQMRKCESAQQIAQQQCKSASLLQTRDQIFQAKTISLQMQCKEEEAKAERRVRQRINYENNLTQLLLKDSSGDIADEFDRRIAKQMAAAERSEANAHSAASAALSDFLQSLGAPSP